MAGKKKQFSNKNQLEKIVQTMEKNKNLAKGTLKKSQAVTYWKKYSEELNSLEPPEKTPEKWSKVWADLKSKIKKKMIENKKDFKATGGGPNVLHGFSPFEESVIRVTSLQPCVNPPGREFGLEDKENSPDIFDFVESDEFGHVDVDVEPVYQSNEVDETSQASSTARIKQRRTPRRVTQEMIIQCIDQQKDFHNYIKLEFCAMKNELK